MYLMHRCYGSVIGAVIEEVGVDLLSPRGTKGGTRIDRSGVLLCFGVHAGQMFFLGE
jgi:hypothetical protein